MVGASELEFAYFAQAFIDALDALGQRPSETQSKRAILKRHLLPSLGAVPLQRLGREIEVYKQAKLAAGLSKKTINNHLSVLRRVLVWAEAAGARTALPRVTAFELSPTEPQFLEADEARRLLAAADGELRCMVLLALRAGLRLSELLALRFDDVDLERGRLRVERAVVRGLELELPPWRRRSVPLAPSVVAALACHPRRGCSVFASGQGAPLSAGACKWPLYRAARRARIPRLGWRALSNTFVRDLVARGAEPAAVHALLGTRSHVAAERGALPSAEELHRVVALLEVKDTRRRPVWRPSQSATRGAVVPLRALDAWTSFVELGSRSRLVEHRARTG